MAHAMPPGFPTVYGRGLIGELAHIANPPVLVVTMADLLPLFGHDLAGMDARLYVARSLEERKLERDLAGLGEVRSVVGLGGGRALDVAKWFAWRLGLPLFQVPTALSVNAAFGQRAGIRRDGRVAYVGWAVPESVFIDYDVIRSAPGQLNWSGIGDILCFHTGVLDWAYARDQGRAEAKWPWDGDLAAQSLARVEAVIRDADEIRALTDRGIASLVEGLSWGTSFHGAGWCPRHIEGTDHFVFYTLEHRTGRAFLHGQPVGLGIVVGSMLHENRADEMLDVMVRIGLDIRPEAMALDRAAVADALAGMRELLPALPLWHSIAHDAPVTPAFVRDLYGRLDRAYRGVPVSGPARR